MTKHQPIAGGLEALVAAVILAACSGVVPPGGGPAGDDDPMATPDAAEVPAVDPCATPVVPAITGRPVELMPAAELATLAARLPCVGPGGLRDTLESPRTMFYDKTTMIPGYQDSFGDNQIAPIGMRPNTIDAGLIDLAVPGGHAQIFSASGVFHFPFGNPIGATEAISVVNFWHAPDGKPVVHWRRDPNQYTHRIEWMFPRGTVFGEILFVHAGDDRIAFEIRTRTRTLDGWAVDAFRPFPAAGDLADALEMRRPGEHVDLVAALRSPDGLAPYEVTATHFASAFPKRTSGIDRLPAIPEVNQLLRTTEFRSARGVYWKSTPSRSAWAAGAAASGSIVPKGYNAAAIEVSEDSCDGCHRDAGRPFMTWYDNILAYGELWGNDETFTWHPFRASRFVDANGRVVEFNYDNRELRSDFKSANLVAPYDAQAHTAADYQRIRREWTDFAY